MENESLYLAYQDFYARFKDILKPTITRSDTGLRITRRRYSTYFCEFSHAAILLMAIPLWEMAHFSLGESSARVRELPSGMNMGSNPKPSLPAGESEILPSSLPKKT